MKVRYSYNRQVTPPAPFVHVTVSRPNDANIALTDLPAQIDTGADFTVVPVSVAEQLNLVQLDQTPILGFGGHVMLVPTYLVGLAVRPFDAIILPVIAQRDEPFVLLGRDILNRYHLELDGPNLAIELRSE